MQHKLLYKRLKRLQHKIYIHKKWLITPVIMMLLLGSLSAPTVSSHASVTSFLSHVKRVLRLGSGHSYHPSAQQQQEINQYKQQINGLQRIDDYVSRINNRYDLNNPYSYGSHHYRDRNGLLSRIANVFRHTPNSDSYYLQVYNDPYSSDGKIGWNSYRLDNISQYKRELKITKDLHSTLESKLPYSDDSTTWGGNSFHRNQLVARYMSEIKNIDGGGETLTTYNNKNAYYRWLARHGETWNALMIHMEEGNLSQHITRLNQLISQHRNHRSPIHKKTWAAHMMTIAQDSLTNHIKWMKTNHLYELEHGQIGYDAHSHHIHHNRNYYHGRHHRGRGRRHYDDNGSGNSYIHDYHESPNPLESDTTFYKQKPKIANFQILQHKNPKAYVLNGNYAGHDGVKEVESPNWARATLRNNYIQFPLNRNLKNIEPIEVYWPDAVKYQGKILGAVMKINPSDTNEFKVYRPYHSQYNSLTRFINVGRDFYDGITYRGFVQGRVTLRFVSNNQYVPITNSLLTFDSLNGERVPINHRVPNVGALDSWSRRAQGNRKTGEYTNYVSSLTTPGVISSNPKSNITQYDSHLLGGYVNGGAADKNFWDGTAGEDAALSGGDPSFFKNSIMYLANNNPSQVFDFGSGNGYAWWKLSTHNLKSHVKLHKSTTHVILRDKTEPYTYTIKGNVPTGLVGKNQYYDFYDNISKQDKIDSTSNNLRIPMKTTGHDVQMNLDENDLQKFANRHYIVKIRVQPEHPDHYNSSWDYIHNTAHAQTPHSKIGSNRVTNMIRHQKKIIHIKPPKNTPLKKSISDIHHTPTIVYKHGNKEIDYHNGGILSHPDEEYNYVIKGNIPTAGYDNVWHEHHWETTYTTPHGRTDTDSGEYPVSTHDYSIASYKFADSLPSKDVSAISVKANKSGLKPKITDNGRGVAMTVNGEDVWKNRGHYKITIRVKADQLMKNPIKHKAWWHIFFNGGTHNQTHGGTIADGKVPYGREADDSTNIHSGKVHLKDYPQHSNKVPVEIKRIEANIYDYNWDNSTNTDDELYPFKDNTVDSLGLPKRCDTGSYIANPQSKYYKNYRYHKYFSQNHGVLRHYTHWGYVNTSFGVDDSDINPTGKTNAPEYRFIDPMYTGNTQSVKSDNTLTDDKFKSEENGLTSNPITSEALRGLRANGSHVVPVNMNPDTPSTDSSGHCSESSDAYTQSGFTQTNYFPYIIPQINIITPPNTPNGNPGNPNLTDDVSKSSRLVIDTDKKTHGLPFHLDTTAYNKMFNDSGNNLNFNRDFNGSAFAGNQNPDTSMVNLTIKDSRTGTTLYDKTRPLASIMDSSTNGSAVAHDTLTPNDDRSSTASGSPLNKRFTNVEYPKGNNQWHGYIDRDALNDVYYHERYDLRTANDSASADDMKKGFPVKATFSLASNPRGLNDTDNPENVSMPSQSIESHAYVARQPKVHQNDFGYRMFQSYDSSLSSTPSNPDTKATYILPERTTKYGTNTNDGTDDNDKNVADVREARERFDMNQPLNQKAKSGYGLTGNVLGMTYMGHINTGQYAEKGSNLMTAYPRHFNTKDSEITSDKDPYGHTWTDPYDSNYQSGSPHSEAMNIAPMLHVDAHYYHLSGMHAENNGKQDGIEKHLPDDLDSYAQVGRRADRTAKYDTAKSGDEYFDEQSAKAPIGHVDGQLHTGIATTSYGYLPKAITTNRRDLDIPFTHGGSNTGMVRLAKLSSMSDKYDARRWTEPKVNIHPILNGVFHENKAIAQGYVKNSSIDTAKSINDKTNGQSERLFTPMFLHKGKYPLIYESMFNYHGADANTKRKHRLGANFITVQNDNDPVDIYAHMLGTTGSDSESNDEFYLQPVLSNPIGLFQIPKAKPAFPKPHHSNNQTDRYDHNHLSSIYSPQQNDIPDEWFDLPIDD